MYNCNDEDDGDNDIMTSKLLQPVEAVHCLYSQSETRDLCGYINVVLLLFVTVIFIIIIIIIIIVIVIIKSAGLALDQVN